MHRYPPQHQTKATKNYKLSGTSNTSPIREATTSSNPFASIRINTLNNEKDEERRSRSYQNNNHYDQGYNSRNRNRSSQSPQITASIDSVFRSSKGDLSVGQINALLLQQSSDNCYLNKYSSKKSPVDNSHQRIHSHSSKQNSQKNMTQLEELNQNRFFSSKNQSTNWQEIEDEIKILKNVLKQNIADLNTSAMSQNENRKSITAKENSSPFSHSNRNQNSWQANEKQERRLSGVMVQNILEENSKLKRTIEQIQINAKVQLEESMQREREEIKVVIDQYKQFIDKLLADKKQLNQTLNQMRIQIQQKEQDCEQLKKINQDLLMDLNSLKEDYEKLANEEQEQFIQRNNQLNHELNSEDQMEIQQQSEDTHTEMQKNQHEEWNEDANHHNINTSGNFIQIHQQQQQQQQQVNQGKYNTLQSSNQQSYFKIEENYMTQVERIDEEEEPQETLSQLTQHSSFADTVYSIENIKLNKDLNNTRTKHIEASPQLQLEQQHENIIEYQLSEIENQEKQVKSQLNYNNNENHQKNHFPKEEQAKMQLQLQKQHQRDEILEQEELQSDDTVNNSFHTYDAAVSRKNDGLLSHLNDVINRISLEKTKIRETLKQSLNSSPIHQSNANNSPQIAPKQERIRKLNPFSSNSPQKPQKEASQIPAKLNFQYDYVDHQSISSHYSKKNQQSNLKPLTRLSNHSSSNGSISNDNNNENSTNISQSTLSQNHLNAQQPNSNNQNQSLKGTSYFNNAQMHQQQKKVTSASSSSPLHNEDNLLQISQQSNRVFNNQNVKGQSQSALTQELDLQKQYENIMQKIKEAQLKSYNVADDKVMNSKFYQSYEEEEDEQEQQHQMQIQQEEEHQTSNTIEQGQKNQTTNQICNSDDNLNSNQFSFRERSMNE